MNENRLKIQSGRLLDNLLNLAYLHDCLGDIEKRERVRFVLYMARRRNKRRYGELTFAYCRKITHASFYRKRRRTNSIVLNLSRKTFTK